MKIHRIRRIKGRSGMTLVELVVSMLLTSMMMAMIVGILSPAAKIFIRMQRLQYAQQILDNTGAQLRHMAEEATQYVKIYADAGGEESAGSAETEVIAGKGGADSGSVLEFVNTEGYVTLISADGCESTDLMLGSTKVGEAEAAASGRLLTRYYNADADHTYSYYGEGGRPVARAVGEVFTDGYYMGNYLSIEFSYPFAPSAAIADGESVTYMEAALSLYNHPDRLPEHLVAREEVLLDFRYQVVRKDAGTARKKADDTGG